MALTKQGVRDLGNSTSKHNLCFDIMNQCSHKNLRACCYKNGKPCGHIICPDCDLYIDVCAELDHDGYWIW